jgi:DNA-binding NtrC family response regulator
VTPSLPLLLIEDDQDFANALKRILEGAGYEVDIAATADRALSAVRTQRFEAALLDFSLPDGDGLRTLTALSGCAPELPILFLTGRNDATLAVRALHAGAADYLIKPVRRAEILLALDSARQRSQLRQPRPTPRASEDVEVPLGSSSAWRHTLELIKLAARSPRTTVLLTGEPGVGKELAAALLHRLSPRREQPFVAVNAACLSPPLIESELFGHEAGSFTGAQQKRRGLFELASSGTLFLDEIGELTMELQSKLLRVLEGHSFRRVGGEREILSDVRLICATNRNLQQRAQSGHFRADLYDRLRVFVIPLPPLRERREDIPELATHFASRIAAGLGDDPPPISKEALRLLCAYPWPGNVRELRNVIERALLLAQGGDILPRHLPAELWSEPASVEPPPPGPPLDLEDATLETAMRRHVSAVYESTDCNVTRAAARLGISRLALRKRLYAYGLRNAKS